MPWKLHCRPISWLWEAAPWNRGLRGTPSAGLQTSPYPPSLPRHGMETGARKPERRPLLTLSCRDVGASSNPCFVSREHRGKGLRRFSGNSPSPQSAITQEANFSPPQLSLQFCGTPGFSPPCLFHRLSRTHGGPCSVLGSRLRAKLFSA